MGVADIAVDNILLGKGIVGATGPCAAVDGEGTVADIADGVAECGIGGVGIGGG